MPPPRPIAGQASAEYVALLAVVGAVVAGAAAVGSPPALAVKLAAALRHGICRVADGVCTAGQARAAGLSPCLVQARTDRQRLGGRVLVVRLGRGDALLVERRSDGSAAVSFTDGASAGATVGVGLRLPSGPRVGARGGAGVQFSAGRTWEFPSFAAAARFVRRWAPRESLGGEAVGLLRGACPICRRPRRRRRCRSPTRPSARAAPTASSPRRCASACAAVGAGAEEEGEAGLILGRRVARGGRVTWYDRVDAETAGRLGALLGAVEARSAGDASLEVTLEHGRPVELRLRAAARWHGDVDLPGATASLRDVAATLRGAPAPAPGGRGRRVEAEVALDLTDPANRRALAGVVDVLRLRVRPARLGRPAARAGGAARRRRRGRRAPPARRARGARRRRRGSARARRGRQLPPHAGGSRPRARLVAARGRRAAGAGGLCQRVTNGRAERSS